MVCQPLVKEFSAVASSATRLQFFDGFGVKNIPEEDIDCHKNTLCILRCERTAELSSYFCQSMTKLRELCLTDFEGESLLELGIKSTTLEELPQSLGHLWRVRDLCLKMKELKEFPSGMLEGMKELKWLRLTLQRVTSMPMQELGHKASLEVKVLPPGFITGCSKLRAFCLGCCYALRELCAETEILSHVESLEVSNCPRLRAIPEGLMKTVQSLVIKKCPSVRGLPGDLDEQKARSMRLLACDAHILPPQFLPLPGVLVADSAGALVKPFIQLQSLVKHDPKKKS
ncbi:hypothetical protein GOP47_0024562 [Adiantum capillus-veneris]|uniref:Uncharacterized protein n=1 Tax=Adiantum capillus-veneris TaxID=13818 RepID=A0A9D4Z4H5_ADICA|nr:hypothetical protein GOP47_0024562 [Adiantum capillus-veneris]